MKFSFFKKKAIESMDDSISKEIKIEIPAEQISSLKLSFIEAFSSHQEFSMTESEKKECINSVISNISEKIKAALESKSEKIMLSGTSINYKLMPHKHMDNAFQIIFDELFETIQSMGLAPEKSVGSSKFIYIKLEDCKKFCKYDSLIALK